MEAPVTADMPPIPLDTLQEWLKVAGISTAGTTWFIEYQHIVTIEDMLLFRPSEAQDLMNIYNGQKTCQTNKFRMDVYKKVVALIYWVQDLQQIHEPIIYTFWTQ